jgi:hypothetical protein
MTCMQVGILAAAVALSAIAATDSAKGGMS